MKNILKNAVGLKNFGPNILIGEPGKIDNDINTIQKKKLIQLRNTLGHVIHLTYRSRIGPPPNCYKAFTVKTNIPLFPDEGLEIPIPLSMQSDALNIPMRRGFDFCEPRIENSKKDLV